MYAFRTGKKRVETAKKRLKKPRNNNQDYGLKDNGYQEVIRQIILGFQQTSTVMEKKS